jgi:hypothetical protein
MVSVRIKIGRLIRNHLKKFWYVYLSITIAVSFGLIVTVVTDSPKDMFGFVDQLIVALFLIIYLSLIFLVGYLIYALVITIYKKMAVFNKSEKDYYLKTKLDEVDENGFKKLSLDFINLIKNRPMDFNLHIPRNNRLLYQFAETRYLLAKFMNMDLSSFAIRHRFTIDTRRFLDLTFILHVIYEHARENDNTMSIMEKIRYYGLYYWFYRKELRDFNLFKDKKHKTKKEKQFISDYENLYVYGYLAVKQDEMHHLIH